MSTDPNQLAEPLGTAVRYALARARKEGKTLTVTSALRTKDDQIRLRRQHCGTTEYDIWEKPAGSCSPPTARPGTSKHEVGRAVDLAGDKEWAAQILAPFGISRPVAGEDWHFEYTGDAAEFMGKPIAQWQIHQDMRARGWTDEEMSAVLGYNVDQSRSLLQKTVDLAITPIAAGAAVIDKAAVVAELAGATLKLVVWILNPANWRRLAFIAAGVLFVVLGAIVVFVDLRGVSNVAGAIPHPAAQAAAAVGSAAAGDE